MKKICLLLIALLIIIPACSSAPTQTSVTSTPTAAVAGNDVAVAAHMSALLTDMELVNKYYDDGLGAMAQVELNETSTASYSETSRYTVQLISTNHYPLNNAPGTSLISTSNVPPEFLKPMPANGSMPGTPGSCPAAAKPTVTFETVDGDIVNPELITEKAIQAIPSELLTMDQSNPDSLMSLVEEAVQSGDRSLATTQGWNNLLWNKLKAKQTAPQSLMDYQLWTASADLEQQINAMYRERILAAGAPAMVVNAFDASASSVDWYTSTPPTPEDSLARMQIEAVMSGSLNGTVHEVRDFHIEGAGNVPEYGVQTGTGTVTWEHPELGTMNFDVDINLDKFDEKGHAISGTTIGIDAEKGYEIRFTFNPDGTKNGELFKDGESIGLLTMTVDAGKFENYLDVKTNESQPLPEVKLK